MTTPAYDIGDANRQAVAYTAGLWRALFVGFTNQGFTAQEAADLLKLWVQNQATLAAAQIAALGGVEGAVAAAQIAAAAGLGGAALPLGRK